MTKLGIGVFVLIVILILGGVGFWVSRPVTAPSSEVVPNMEIIPEPQVPSPSPISTGEFNKTINLKVGEKLIFTDGLTLQVKEINDSRCKPDVQCIWQGELSVKLVFSNGSTASSPTELVLGTVNNKSLTSLGYKFTLESATENSARVTVLKVKEVQE